MHVMEKVRSKNRRGRGRENSNTQQKKRRERRIFKWQSEDKHGDNW